LRDLQRPAGHDPALDAVLHEKNEFKQGMYNLLSKWTEAYTELFLPYLKTLNGYKTIKDIRGRITLSNKIKLEKYSEHLRVLSRSMLKTLANEPGPAKEHNVYNIRLNELAEDLCQLLDKLNRILNRELIQHNAPEAINLLKELARQGVADFQAHNYKPTIKRIKEVLEQQYKTANLNASPKAQFSFFEILIMLARLYCFLLNDPASFYRKAPEGVLLAGAEEERLWNRAHKTLSGSLN
jgi:hypothetical protein